MNLVPATITVATRAAVALSLLFLGGTGAVAANGSTDIYANEFAQSFGAQVDSKQPLDFPVYSNGSTDAWGNRFQESFGPSEPGAETPAVCSTGSTDTWAAGGFRKSFGAAASPESNELIGLCDTPTGPIR
jgi:hypothetical protein